MNSLDDDCVLKVVARDSRLSKAQVDEVFSALQKITSKVRFSSHFIKTTGDVDLKTSLFFMGKTDFFTKEVDECLLAGVCRIAIHSAKDLPENVHEDLEVIAYTKGVDPCDVLVFRRGEGLLSVPLNAKVGLSSLRRSLQLKAIYPNFQPVDIRGPIDERLKLLDEGGVDAVIMAKAALIRLNLQRDILEMPWEPTPLQGRLAIIAKRGDEQMKALFSHLHEPLV